MQSTLVTTAIVLGVTAFGVFIVWVIRRQIEWQAAADRAWRAYAERRHLKWTDASGPWYRRIGYQIDGDIDGVRAKFDQFTVSTGKSSVRYSRVSAELARAAPERLIVCRKSFNNRVNFAFQGPLLELDGSSGAEPLLVRSKSETFARSMVDQRLRSALYALPPRTTVELRDRQAKVWWLGAERDPAVLDRAANLLVGVVRAAAKA